MPQTNAERCRARRKRLKSKNLCVRCARRRTGGKALCEKCRRRDTTFIRMKRRGRTERGMCSECGERPILRDRRNAASCAECRAARPAEVRKRSGLCAECGRRTIVRDRENAATCAECRLKTRRSLAKKNRERTALRRKRRKLGVCTDCGKGRPVADRSNGYRCRDCRDRTAKRKGDGAGNKRGDGPARGEVGK